MTTKFKIVTTPFGVKVDIRPSRLEEVRDLLANRRSPAQYVGRVFRQWRVDRNVEARTKAATQEALDWLQTQPLPEGMRCHLHDPGMGQDNNVRQPGMMLQ